MEVLTNRIINEEISVDLWIDQYHQFDRLYHEEEELPDEKQVQQWMKRWPSGLNEDVRAIRRQNKERIISLLIQKSTEISSLMIRFVKNFQSSEMVSILISCSVEAS